VGHLLGLKLPDRLGDPPALPWLRDTPDTVGIFLLAKACTPCNPSCNSSFASGSTPKALPPKAQGWHYLCISPGLAKTRQPWTLSRCPVGAECTLRWSVSQWPQPHV